MWNTDQASVGADLQSNLTNPPALIVMAKTKNDSLGVNIETKRDPIKVALVCGLP